MLRIESLLVAIVIASTAPCYGFDADNQSCSDAFGAAVGQSEEISSRSSYLDEIERRIRSKWRPEGGEDSRPAIVVCSVNRNGQISRVRLKQSSHTFSIDRAALNALALSNPLPAIPPDLADHYCVEITFNTDVQYFGRHPSLPGVFGTIVVPEPAGQSQSKIDWAPYVKQLEQRATSRWHQGKNQACTHTQVQFRILRDGSLANLKLSEASSVNAINQAALQAVKLSSPFNSLPPGSPRSVLCFLDFNQSPPVAPAPIRSYPRAPSLAAQADVDFGPYMADLQRKIKAAWPPIQSKEPKRSVVVFKVWKDGHISHLRLEKPSNDQGIDQSSIEAIKKAAPFGPMPKGASDDVDIQFTFDVSSYDLDSNSRKPLQAYLSRSYGLFTSRTE
jgi:TonB family protein